MSSSASSSTSGGSSSGASQNETSSTRNPSSSAPSSATSLSRSVPGDGPRRLDRTHRLREAWRSISPAQLLVGSFLVLIALGTLGFRLLPGLYTGASLSWLDALFTATSAVCVTGLIVVDTATYFTVWGQAYVLLLIQLGGLGIISLTSIFIVALGQRLSLRHQALATGPSRLVADIDYRDLTRAVLWFTLGIEAAGALALYLAWAPDLGWTGAVWPAVFHSISAFCNAGFSTFSTSLSGFQHNVPLLLVVMGLIVVGGLGFLTLEELYLWSRGHTASSGRFRMSIHSQLVLGTSAALLVLGGVAFTAFEWENTLAGMPAGARVVNGLFASVTPRTAGFNTIDYAETWTHTNMLTILFMTIGGSPGSTAGGLKTTTFALLGLLAWARLRGMTTTSISGRTIPGTTLQKATGLLVVGLGLLTAGIFVYSVVEVEGIAETSSSAAFIDVVFEAASAFNTVGLSTGITGDLSVSGRWTTIVLMFIGRVGPLTLAAALSRNRRRAVRTVRYAHEDVVVG